MTRRLTAAVLATIIAAGTALAFPPGPSPVRCAHAIEYVTASLADSGLAQLQACQRRRVRGRAKTPCIPLAMTAGPAAAPHGSPFGIAVQRASARLDYYCKPSDAPTLGFLRERFGKKAIAGEDTTAPKITILDELIVPAVEELLGRSSSDLQGDVTLRGDRAGLACHDRLGSARTRVVRRALRVAARCAVAERGRNAVPAPLSDACLARLQRVARHAVAAVRETCARVSASSWSQCLGRGAADCAAHAAGDLATRLARLAWGPGDPCGNGLLEPEFGETCDDGNTANDDACTSECKENVCGDGFVFTGVEECDDGNLVDDDGCSNACRAAVCGNGVVERGEECDDGNTDPTDGCDACRQVVICGANGLTAALRLHGIAFAGVTLELRYPSQLSIPGNGFETDDSRFTDLTGFDGPTSAFVDRDTDGDGVDDTCRLVWAVPGTEGIIGDNDAFAIHFDCDVGAVVRRSDLPCTITTAADTAGNVYREPNVGCSVSIR